MASPKATKSSLPVCRTKNLKQVLRIPGKDCGELELRRVRRQWTVVLCRRTDADRAAPGGRPVG